jgi:hypothetical protein
MAALLRIIARHPVVSFMVLGLGAGFLTVAIPPIVETKISRFLIFSAVIVLPATTVIIATKGRLGRATEPLRA